MAVGGPPDHDRSPHFRHHAGAQRRAYVGEAVASVLNQTCGDWELIVVDDGSSDSTADILPSMPRPTRAFASSPTRRTAE